MHVSSKWISAVALLSAAWTRSAAGPAAPDAVADSPVGLMHRFEQAYEARDLDAYAELFTADYRFYPSDPSVAARCPNGWRRADEIASADHLFHGFTDATGVYRARATKISLELSPYRVEADPEHTDSTAYYSVYIVPSVTLQVWTASGDDFIEHQEHDYYVVRGDAAVLEQGQDGSADSWYIRKWVENPPKAPVWAMGDPDRVATP